LGEIGNRRNEACSSFLTLKKFNVIFTPFLRHFYAILTPLFFYRLLFAFSLLFPSVDRWSVPSVGFPDTKRVGIVIWLAAIYNRQLYNRQRDNSSLD